MRKFIVLFFASLLFLSSVNAQIMKIYSGNTQIASFKSEEADRLVLRETEYSYVDLGLPSGKMWADRNLGASYSEAYGKYYTWGDTSEKSRTSITEYKFYEYANGSPTKYNQVDGVKVLESSDDAARALWSIPWHIPTKEDWEELIAYCTWTSGSLNGTKGWKATSKKNGKSIFLPYAGRLLGGTISGKGTSLNYWSSTLNRGWSAYALYWGSGSFPPTIHEDDRYNGLPIRPVCDAAQVFKVYKGNTLKATVAPKATFVFDPTVNVTSVSITGTKTEIAVGESLQLSATVSPSYATNKAVTWTTSNSSVATVSASGLVKAVKAGSVTISATAQDGSGARGTYTITVINPVVSVTSIAVTGSKKEIYGGESLQLSATVSPSNATNKSVTWTTSNSSVATVSTSGLVKAVKAGSVIITATARDGSGVRGTYTLTVKDPIVSVTFITITGSKEEITVGESLQLSATVSPSYATNKSVAWTTSNSSVATVSASGLVKAVKPGSVTITAIAQDGSLVRGTYKILVLTPHEYVVDLGLSVKWATCNIGASKPEDYGDHFAWGETMPQEYNEYNKESYKWFNDFSDTMAKYWWGDNKMKLEFSDDAAHANWGGSWRMPTKEEQDELRTECNWVWFTLNGVGGYKVIGPNGNSIFLPAAGLGFNGSFSNVGTDGYYWSSSLVTGNSSDYAHSLNFGSRFIDWSYYGEARFLGLSVRAVCP